MINYQSKTKLSTDWGKFDFTALRLSVASPEEILQWSYGEVTKPETINYRTQKPEREGLFDERIFGPVKDWECYCGKYKGIRYKGVVCDKCGVEITRSVVRRERMGHIDLITPVSHIWYLRGAPSTIGLILDLPLGDLEKVIYFSAYIILDVNEKAIAQAVDDLGQEYEQLKPDKQGEKLVELESDYQEALNELKSLKVGRVLPEGRYLDLSMKYGQVVKVGIGAEAIDVLLKRLDIQEEIKKLHESINEKSELKEKRRVHRLRLLSNLQQAGIGHYWLIMRRLPVLPPGLRPMVQLDGGRFATSDLNDLYRRVINRNNRLRRLIEQGAPEVICRNEKRMLQEAVDSLIDNAARRSVRTGTAAIATAQLRSLSDILRGKQGRFRQNLLGKRVDYSGRSVIVVGPDLQLDQCGLPKIMALELFKTFVISKLISDGHVHNVKNAVRLIEKQEPVVWDILEAVTKNRYILLNRAPTLHRLGIQAFRPVLIEGKAIQVHPLVCYAFNADFDGDQMAVHIPLSKQSCQEAAEIMRSSNNLLKPSSGQPVVSARLDIVLGCYWLTMIGKNLLGENRYFASPEEAILAQQAGGCHLQAKILVRLKEKEKPIETSVGRLLFNRVLPAELGFINRDMNDKSLRKIVAESFKKFSRERTVQLVDDIKNLGFKYAGLSGLTVAIEDIYTPPKKWQLIDKANRQVEEIEKQYRQGLITDTERNAKLIELWTMVKATVETQMIEGFGEDNPLMVIVKSGARGSLTQMAQLGGMKGLVVSPTGDIIEVPIRSNYREGLNVLEYFISTHGARKGKSDTSLRTSDAGYLTRRLVDVAQDLVVTEVDCGGKSTGIMVRRQESESAGVNFAESLTGRILAQPLVDKQGRKIARVGQEITEKLAIEIDKLALGEIKVRSVLTCMSERGICQQCYGRDLATSKIVAIGTVVGIIAAQAIGEPGTQLTMTTFHTGGVSGGDITTGLLRVEEIFEARPPRAPAVLADLSGKVKIKEEKNEIILEITGKSNPKDKELKIAKHSLPLVARLKIEDGQEVQIGHQLIEGLVNLRDLLRLKGKEAVQQYILRGVQEIYTSQGQQINDKHIEIMIRQMFSKMRVLDAGDSGLIEGQLISKYQFQEINQALKKKDKKFLKAEELLLGITRAALNTESFLAAASFQETTSILVNASLRGAIDNLRGLKENVIIGKLIPAGTGYEVKRQK